VSVIVVAAGTAAATSTTPTTSVTHLSHGDGVLVVALVVAFVLLAGAVVALGRRALEGAPLRKAKSGSNPTNKSASPKDAPDSTLVRSWLAISLVGGLLIFAAVSFWLDDTTLRSTLIGGVIANAGAAVAFYFASKSSDQARRDILSAALPSTLVPDLVGNNLATAQQAVAATPFRLEVSPPNPSADAQVVSQHPTANQPAMAGSPIAAAFAGPVPNVTGSTIDQAQSMLAAVGLQLAAVPAQPPAGSTITSQDPAVGAAVPTDLTVRGTFG
jgi:hypothetical protein